MNRVDFQLYDTFGQLRKAFVFRQLWFQISPIFTWALSFGDGLNHIYNREKPLAVMEYLPDLRTLEEGNLLLALSP